MSIESRIIAAVSGTGLPCRYGIYEGGATTYLTFNVNSIPANFADDAPQHERWLVQLHLFAPFTTDTTTVRGQIKEALLAADFSYPVQLDASNSVRDSDGTERHIVFEFEAAEGAGYG